MRKNNGVKKTIHSLFINIWVLCIVILILLIDIKIGVKNIIYSQSFIWYTTLLNATTDNCCRLHPLTGHHSAPKATDNASPQRFQNRLPNPPPSPAFISNTIVALLSGK